MKCWRIKLRLTSPSGTPWQSDTVFGHLCWQVVYGALDMSIDDFLAPFRDGKPPFVLSDGLPEGYMPRPMFDLDFPEAKTVEDYARFKAWKKAKFITFADFLRICNGENPLDKPAGDPWMSTMTPHASIDRGSLSVSDEGGFYETVSHSLSDFEHLDVYFRAEGDWTDRVVALFEGMSMSGFGRDKSTGLGAFLVSRIEEVRDFDDVESPSGFVSISSVVPAVDDPTNARYRLRTKYGKLGEGVFSNPFKRPVLQMEPGAVFYTTGEVRPICGRLVEDIAPGMPEAVQNCYGLAVGFSLPKE